MAGSKVNRKREWEWEKSVDLVVLHRRKHKTRKEALERGVRKERASAPCQMEGGVAH
jgi:hypothetical protein